MCLERDMWKLLWGRGAWFLSKKRSDAFRLSKRTDRLLAIFTFLSPGYSSHGGAPHAPPSSSSVWPSSVGMLRGLPSPHPPSEVALSISDSPPHFYGFKCEQLRDFLVVQWLRLHTPNAEGLEFDPRSGKQITHATTKSPHALTKMDDPTCCN